MNLEVLCSFCCKHLNNTEAVYAILKCGHVYHAECLRGIIGRGICTVCHASFDSRQCRKLSLFSQSSNPFDKQKNKMSLYEYDWMYCDQKTILDQRELTNCLLKLGTDWQGNDLYAARAFLDKHVMPAFYIPSVKYAVATYVGHAYELKDNFDILDISSDYKDLYKWVKYENNEIPENAFDILKFPNDLEPIEIDATETNSSEEKVFFARGEHKGKILYGKLSSKQNCDNNFYFAFGSEEIKLEGEENFDVLVRDTF